MRRRIEIENIEEIRRREGIDDVELRDEIRRLAAGDLVRLSLLTGPTTFETLTVRITSIHGTAFRGKLTSRPTAKCLSDLNAGYAITFTADHVHSLAKGATPVNNDPLTMPAKHLRATDTNSLLRLYDRLNDLQRQSLSRQEQARAAKALTRVAQELRRRNVPLSTAPI